MRRIVCLLAVLLYPLLLSTPIPAQDSNALQFDAVIADVRSGEEPRGFFIDPPDPVAFVQIAATTLETPGTRILDTDGLTRLSLNDLQTGDRVHITGTQNGAAFIAREVTLRQRVRHIWLDGVIIEIERTGSHSGHVALLEFGERIDPRANVYIDGEDKGAGLLSIIDLLNRTNEPVVATVSWRNAFENNGLFGRVDIGVGTPQPIREEVNDAITFQLPADPDRAVYISERENALREIPSVIPINENVIIRSDLRDGAEVAFDDLSLYARVYVNARVAGSEIVSAEINVANMPREVRLSFEVNGLDEVTNTVNLGADRSIRMASGALFLDLNGNPVSPHEFEQRQWDMPETATLITLDTDLQWGREARLIEWHEGFQPGPNQALRGVIDNIYRGVWVSTDEAEIGTRDLTGILLDDTVMRTPEGDPLPLGQLDWGLQVDASGFVARDEFVVRELVVQNRSRDFSFTTQINEFRPEHHWFSFETLAPLRASREVEAFDHFGDPVSLSLLADLVERIDLQLLLTFTEEQSSDGSRAVVKIEAFRPDADVPVAADQRLIRGARIHPWDDPPLIFPGGIDNANFNHALEVIDLSGSPTDLRVLAPRIPVRVHGWVLTRPHRENPNETEQIVRVHRIEILGGERTLYRGDLATVQDSRLIFRAPSAFLVEGHTDLQEETGFQTDFLTLAARIRSEGSLRVHLGADFNTAGLPHLWWARVLSHSESAPTYLSENERVVTFIDADDSRRILIPEPLPDIQLTNDTQIVNQNGDILSRDLLTPDARVTVQAEMRSGEWTAIEVRVEAIPERFTVTADLEEIDVQNRIVQYAAPNAISVSENAQILGIDGEELSLNDLIQQLRSETPRFLRITQTADSPSERPLASRIEVLEDLTALDAQENQFIVYVEDPGARIYPHEQRIEPSPLPNMVVADDAEILDINGQPIDLSDVWHRMRVQITGYDARDRIVVRSLRVLGYRIETGEGIIAGVDPETRTLIPAPDPPQPISQHATYIASNGQPTNASGFADDLAQNPSLILIATREPFGGLIQHLQLVDRNTIGRTHPELRYFLAGEVTLDVANSQLTFQAFPAVQVAEGAPITGSNGETLALSDLQTGQHVFVRGYNTSDNHFVVTAIFVRRQIDAIHLHPQVIDGDGDGIENDVRIDVVDQTDTPLNETFRLHLNYHTPEDIRTGHVLYNLRPGPHILGVDIPNRPGFADRVRVFISALGSAFRIVDVRPSANATGVPAVTDLEITFTEPLHQVGDYLAIEGAIIPEPLDESSEPELLNEGRTLRLPNMRLAENTDYTVVIFSAASAAGNTLSQTYRTRFSTGGNLIPLSTLSGVVTLSENVPFVGQVRIFNEEGRMAAEVPLSTSGAFDMADLGVGAYRLHVEVQTEDGRTANAFWDENSDGAPDDITLASGESRHLDLTLTLPEAPVTETTGTNANARVVFDLDTTNGNQNHEHQDVLPGHDVQVAVYAQNVTELMGYELALTYDSQKLIFQRVDDSYEGETNILRQNGGLAVSVPPIVSSGRIAFAGAILGATESQVISGNGLLAVFRFRARSDFSEGTDIQISRVVFQNQTGADILASDATASISPSQSRTVLRLSADPDRIPADGNTTATIRAELVDATGNRILDGRNVQFDIISGNAYIDPVEVVSSNGIAETRLSGAEPGRVTVLISADGVSDQISVTLETGSDSGPTGPMALDLNTQPGDQGLRHSTAPEIGETFIVDLVATHDARNLAGYQAVLTFDPEQLAFERFIAGGIFDDATPITLPETGSVTANVAFLGTGPTAEDAGTMGHATFRILEGFTGSATVTLSSAIFSTATQQHDLDVTNASVTVTTETAGGFGTDFDGDGQVGFSDFIAFASAFGRTRADAQYDARFDLNGNGSIDFPDFIAFAQSYGQPAGKPVRASKIIGHRQSNATLTTQSHTIDPEHVRLTVQLDESPDIQGYGLQLHYDPSEMVFTGAQSDLISQFTSQNVALITERTPGTLHIADALQTTVSDGDLIHLDFRVLDPTATSRVEIAEALIADSAGGIYALTPHATDLRAIPMDYALDQNYPNPFNPETVVPFALPEAGDMRLTVYNMLGQEVRVLAQGAKEAGYHRVVWDGKDALGRAIASGIYFVRLQSQSFTSVRKMILLK